MGKYKIKEKSVITTTYVLILILNRGYLKYKIIF